MNGLRVDLWVSEVVSGKKQASGRKLGRTIAKMKKGDTLIIMTIMGKCLKKGINSKIL